MKIVTQEVKPLAEAVRAYNHQLRQRILTLLQQKGPMTVTDIFIQLRLEQSVASQHLGILRKADLVCTKPDGKHIYYTVKESSVRQLKNLAEHWSNNTEPQPSARSLIPSSLELAAM